MASKYNMDLDQGADFRIDFTLSDVDGVVPDFSDYDSRSQMRKHYSSNSFISFIVNAYSNGVISLTLDSAASANISPGRYFYDVEVISSSNVVTRVVEGIINVTPNITR